MRNVFPYVGITGFMNKEEREELLRVLPADQSSPRKLMVGVLANSKTLKRLTPKRPNRYPAAEKITEIFGPHLSSFNVIHYTTKEPGTLLLQLKELVELGGPHLEGIQLNLCWPDPRILENFQNDCVTPFNWRGFILQVGAKALAAVRHCPTLLADKLKSEYREFVDYVLLDESGGEGKPLDAEYLAPFIEEILEKTPELGIGVAGGLCCENLRGIPSLIKKYPRISIDAEGRLRDENDNLDCEAAKDYLTAALEMFGE